MRHESKSNNDTYLGESLTQKFQTIPMTIFSKRLRNQVPIMNQAQINEITTTESFETLHQKKQCNF